MSDFTEEQMNVIAQLEHNQKQIENLFFYRCVAVIGVTLVKHYMPESNILAADGKKQDSQREIALGKLSEAVNAYDERLKGLVAYNASLATQIPSPPERKA